MKDLFMKRVASALLIALLLGMVSSVYAQSDTGSTDAPKQNTTDTPKYGPVFQLETKDQASGEGFRGMKVEKKFTRRLPNFYREVISDSQRDKVYEIQAAYFGPVQMLTLRLDRLTAERDAQIEAVLTAEQKKKVEALRKESTARSAERRSANRKANSTADEN